MSSDYIMDICRNPKVKAWGKDIGRRSKSEWERVGNVKDGKREMNKTVRNRKMLPS